MADASCRAILHEQLRVRRGRICSDTLTLALIHRLATRTRSKFRACDKTTEIRETLKKLCSIDGIINDDRSKSARKSSYFHDESRVSFDPIDRREVSNLKERRRQPRSWRNTRFGWGPASPTAADRYESLG